ncbi:hypothetical protein [Colwellia psychrerythraea]|uniref:Uncharacterized protein n=1 Tax=Colwellia psychrerythraea (strain 34H / ATCC BAA-681) TaxID=167879 RepID=Q489F9_COLP3|nr:hypothetical protein [Colwellia psychrerythraea]AAZ25858.1 hypothetical protein CPS_0547 [Colwellia psychrerythraea 34H]
MSKVIKALEKMGQDSSLDNELAITLLLTSLKINTNQIESIINNDIASLKQELDICPDIKCFIIPAEDDDETNDEQESADESNNLAIGF